VTPAVTADVDKHGGDKEIPYCIEKGKSCTFFVEVFTWYWSFLGPEICCLVFYTTGFYSGGSTEDR
jgi:hypothetical protein